MPRLMRAVLTLLFLAAPTAQAEHNLVRPPGTTRYAPMVARLRAVLAYDRSQGAHRMALSSIGRSVQGRDIWMVTIQAPPVLGAGGAAPKKLFCLCRQHGHEPASTEGALAFITTLVKAQPDSPLARDLERVTVFIVPMANPDGAEAFRRHNAHDVDLNRDWLRQTQPETRAWVAAIRRIHPDLMTDQHELYPNDTRWDFTETAGVGSGANPGVVATCTSTQAIVSGAMQAEGHPTVSHLIQDHHPARLAHRYGCLVVGIPTLLFETNRLTWLRRSVAARAASHEQFMTDMLRDLAGEQAPMEAEARLWQIAHARNAALLASRKKRYQRNLAPPVPHTGGAEKNDE